MAVSSATNSETFRVTTPSDQEIQLTRLFDAPRNLVVEAMTTPCTSIFNEDRNDAAVPVVFRMIRRPCMLFV